MVLRTSGQVVDVFGVYLAFHSSDDQRPVGRFLRISELWAGQTECTDLATTRAHTLYVQYVIAGCDDFRLSSRFPGRRHIDDYWLGLQSKVTSRHSQEMHFAQFSQSTSKLVHARSLLDARSDSNRPVAGSKPTQHGLPPNLSPVASVQT